MVERRILSRGIPRDVKAKKEELQTPTADPEASHREREQKSQIENAGKVDFFLPGTPACTRPTRLSTQARPQKQGCSVSTGLISALDI